MTPDYTKYKQIGSVSKELGLDQSTLRYWETKFSIVKPHVQDKKRFYDEALITLLKGINLLITKKGYTTKRVQRLIEEKGGDHIIEIAELPLIRHAIPEAEDTEEVRDSLPCDHEIVADNEIQNETADIIVDLSNLWGILKSASFGISLGLPEDGKVGLDKSARDKLEQLYGKLEKIYSGMA
ncbi:MAG: MerR family transcriptional regulator [Rhodobacteraceae bacterium]|nr:MerR family transcriptional regulator [Paracoccaceae bacterium]MCY4249253.1 MerR family transcriptional regulator [Paracoccaceae bacterium]MCY4308211.1 MerR family transcriptional regulator [Paracoccaceae bacterium]